MWQYKNLIDSVTSGQIVETMNHIWPAFEYYMHNMHLTEAIFFFFENNKRLKLNNKLCENIRKYFQYNLWKTLSGIAPRKPI